MVCVLIRGTEKAPNQPASSLIANLKTQLILHIPLTIINSRHSEEHESDPNSSLSCSILLAGSNNSKQTGSVKRCADITPASPGFCVWNIAAVNFRREHTTLPPAKIMVGTLRLAGVAYRVRLLCFFQQVPHAIVSPSGGCRALPGIRMTAQMMNSLMHMVCGA